MSAHDDWFRDSDGWTLPPCGHLECAQEKPRCDGSALDEWDNLPPHLREALRGALEGLRDAFEDQAHPFSPALQAVWDVTDQIEAHLLAQEASERDSELRE